MISASIKGGSLKKALRDISRSTKKKSFKRNKALARKISRRFRKAARDAARELAVPVASETGLSRTQAKRRVRSSKKISSRRFKSEVFTRGQALKVHAGRLKSLRVTKKGIKVKGKFVKGGFITRETFKGKKELRRVLVRKQKGIEALTYPKKQILKVYQRHGPRIARRHSRKLLVEVGRMVRAA